jgi:hypothetical protein
MQYTKKPITVEALIWTGKNHREMFEFLGGSFKEHLAAEGDNFEIDFVRNPNSGLMIKTLEGDMQANIGDYIIKGVKGEYYPCKPEIFHLTYNERDDINAPFNALYDLTKLQNHYGYVKGPIDPVALLGLFGEAGEVLNEMFLIDNGSEFIKAEDLKLVATSSAKVMDQYKKKLRKKECPAITINISDPPAAFDTELADCFYYLHALAINRGLTLEDLAQISLDKIKSFEAKQEALG